MTGTTNFDDLRRLHKEARARGTGSKQWIEFATAMVDAFPALYDTAKAMNEDAARLREEPNRLRSLLAECAPMVYANAEALHMLDGFRPQEREFDDLARRLRDELTPNAVAQRTGAEGDRSGAA